MIKFDAEYFNIEDTLDCGQVFRFKRTDEGFTSFALDKCARIRAEGESVIIDCDDEDFWYEYFDLSADYAALVKRVLACGNAKVVEACSAYKGIRILRQSRYEALISFIISQNNNIPRIKSTIEKLCAAFGERKSFRGEEYYAFPTAERLSKCSVQDFTALGLGYRAEYLCGVTNAIASGSFDLAAVSLLPTEKLRDELLKIKGVGNKVADCAILFGFHKTDSFPVDTWIEKLYHEDFGGELTDRKKISEYFLSLFGEDSGLVQQYLFHAKRKNTI